MLEQNARKSLESGNKLKDLKVREMELKIAMMENKFAPVDECFAVVDQVIGAMIAELDSLPARFTRDLAERDRLERLINEARRQVVKKLTDVEGQIKTNGALDGDDTDMTTGFLNS